MIGDTIHNLDVTTRTSVPGTGVSLLNITSSFCPFIRLSMFWILLPRRSLPYPITSPYLLSVDWVWTRSLRRTYIQDRNGEGHQLNWWLRSQRSGYFTALTIPPLNGSFNVYVKATGPLGWWPLTRIFIIVVCLLCYVNVPISERRDKYYRFLTDSI